MCFKKKKTVQNPKANSERISNHDQAVSYVDNDHDNVAECEVYSDNNNQNN